MSKKLLAAALALILALTFTACEVTVKQQGEETGAPANTVTPENPTVMGVTAAPGTSSPTPDETAAPELPPVRAIVFDDTTDDPTAAMLGDSMPAQGTDTLKLTLFETSPGVYSGEGAFYRAFEITPPEGMEMMYMTATDSHGRLYLEGVGPGIPGRSTLLSGGYYVSGMPIKTGSTYSHYVSRPFNTYRSDIDYALIVDGDKASISIKMGTSEFTFSGEVTTLSPSKPKASLDQLNGRVIAVNSTFYESGKSYNNEYRAMLTAAPESGSTYAGDLCVYGTGRDIPFVDGTVSFEMKPFDEAAYKSAGGGLAGSFDAFGIIDGGYIMLLDGETTLLEPVNSEIAFYGRLIAPDQAAEARRIANESKQLMRTLYDGCDKTKPGVTASMINGKPDWYPDWLLPAPTKPVKQWVRSGMVNETAYNIYSVTYEESFAAVDDVFESYLAHLAGSDSLTHHDNFSELGSSAEIAHGGEAVICFTKGAYSVMLNIHQLPTGVSVTVYII